eukprot:461184_1
MAGAVSSNVQFTRVCVHAKKTYLCNDERNHGLPCFNATAARDSDNYVEPLAPYWGRVEIPYQHDSDVDEAQDNMNTEKRIEAKQAKEDQEINERSDVDGEETHKTNKQQRYKRTQSYKKR